MMSDDIENKFYEYFGMSGEDVSSEMKMLQLHSGSQKQGPSYWYCDIVLLDLQGCVQNDTDST